MTDEYFKEGDKVVLKDMKYAGYFKPGYVYTVEIHKLAPHRMIVKIINGSSYLVASKSFFTFYGIQLGGE